MLLLSLAIEASQRFYSLKEFILPKTEASCQEAAASVFPFTILLTRRRPLASFGVCDMCTLAIVIAKVHYHKQGETKDLDHSDTELMSLYLTTTENVGP